MERDSRGRFRSEHETIETPEAASLETWDDVIGRMQAIQEMRRPLDIWKDQIDIKVNTSRTPYFFLNNLSDPHIGSEFTDYAYLVDHMKKIHEARMKIGLYGDMMDAYNPKILPEAMMDTVANPDEQLMALRLFHEEYEDDILYEAGGNHDDWVRKSSGVEPFRWVTRGLDVPLLNNGGRVNLDVNGVKYSGLVYHRIKKFQSSFTPTHAGKQMMRNAEDVDFVVAGDKHIFGMEKAQLRDKKVAVVQLGTTKIEDKFGKRGQSFGPKPQIGFPTLVFSGEKKNIEMIEDVDEAIKYQEALRMYHGEVEMDEGTQYAP